MTDHDKNRRAYLEVVPPSDGGFRSALENARHEELTEALEIRANAGHKTAFAAIRAEIHRRNAEGGVPCRIPCFAEYCAKVAASHEAIAAEHSRYASAAPHQQAIMRAHGYKAPAPAADLPSSLPMAKTNTSNALALVADPAFAVANSDLEKLQFAAVAQIAAVAQMESNAARGGVLAGITLHRVKASLGHGSFRPWLESANVNFGSHLSAHSRVKIANNYMRLASAFLEKAKVTKPSLLALPGDQTAIELGDNHPSRDLFEKLDSFVGTLSLNELLIAHGIKDTKKLGGARTAGEAEAEADAAPSPESLAATVRDEVGGAIERLETLILKEARLAHVAADHAFLRGVAQALGNLALKGDEKIRELLALTGDAAARRTLGM